MRKFSIEQSATLARIPNCMIDEYAETAVSMLLPGCVSTFDWPSIAQKTVWGAASRGPDKLRYRALCNMTALN